jgi:hypothetical protein
VSWSPKLADRDYALDVHTIAGATLDLIKDRGHRPGTAIDVAIHIIKLLCEANGKDPVELLTGILTQPDLLRHPTAPDVLS